MFNTFTKIVATIGPASRSEEAIRAILKEGASVIRLNFSHGNWEDHQMSVELVRKISAEMGRETSIFQDLQGPKIRIGQLSEGARELKTGDTLVLSTDPADADCREAVWIDYPRLHEEARGGHRILIDDGLIALKVTSLKGHRITCEVVDGGLLKSRKGVNLPHITLEGISSFTEKDEKDLAFAFEHNLDFVALSFVRDHYDVRALKDLMVRKYGRALPVIAKIEKPEALQDLPRIIETADALMVARGDLGVETSPEEVPIAQKEIIRLCAQAGVPVITATQMLESMIENPRPTRAEAGDVANAILDGTSAVMLSGETAAGKYPVEAVTMMVRIARKTEASVPFRQGVLRQHQEKMIPAGAEGEASPTEAVGLAARELATSIGAKYIVCFTHSGGTAQLISKARPCLLTVALSPSLTTVRKLALSWGILPFKMEELTGIDDLLFGAPAMMRDAGLVQPGDYIVITAGVPVGRPGKTNMIKVVKISGE